MTSAGLDSLIQGNTRIQSMLGDALGEIAYLKESRRIAHKALQIQPRKAWLIAADAQREGARKEANAKQREGELEGQLLSLDFQLSAARLSIQHWKRRSAILQLKLDSQEEDLELARTQHRLLLEEYSYQEDQRRSAARKYATLQEDLQLREERAVLVEQHLKHQLQELKDSLTSMRQERHASEAHRGERLEALQRQLQTAESLNQALERQLQKAESLNQALERQKKSLEKDVNQLQEAEQQPNQATNITAEAAMGFVSSMIDTLASPEHRQDDEPVPLLPAHKPAAPQATAVQLATRAAELQDQTKSRAPASKGPDRGPSAATQDVGSLSGGISDSPVQAAAANEEAEPVVLSPAPAGKTKAKQQEGKGVGSKPNKLQQVEEQRVAKKTAVTLEPQGGAGRPVRARRPAQAYWLGTAAIDLSPATLSPSPFTVDPDEVEDPSFTEKPFKARPGEEVQEKLLKPSNDEKTSEAVAAEHGGNQQLEKRKRKDCKETCAPSEVAGPLQPDAAEAEPQNSQHSLIPAQASNNESTADETVKPGTKLESHPLAALNPKVLEAAADRGKRAKPSTTAHLGVRQSQLSNPGQKDATKKRKLQPSSYINDSLPRDLLLGPPGGFKIPRLKKPEQGTTLE